MTLRNLLVAGLLTLPLASPALATQHLVRPGDKWSDLASRVGPGDEIILMPGKHRDASLARLTGTSAAPITIRGLDAEQPPIIEAGRYGLRLQAPRHVHVKNLMIVGATIHAMSIEAAPPVDEDEAGTTDPETPGPAGHVTIKHVTLLETGPRGQRHALNLRHLTGVVIEDCRIEGWAGTGIEVVGCRQVRVDDTVLIGRDGFAQVSGIRLRAGSERVEISRCHFKDFGEQAISMGAGSDLADFEPPLPADAKPATLAEATDIRVHRCLFEGGQCAVSFVNCSQGTVEYCTIKDPARAVVSIREEQTDPRFGPSIRCGFDANLITWSPKGLERLTHLGPNTDPAGIAVGENLWWGPAPLEDYPGHVVFPQITDVDPDLDDALNPTAEAAALYGASVP